MAIAGTKKIPIRVLLAEDEALVGDVIEHELQKGGFDVVGRARNGSLAVEMTQSLKPDIVLMDIEMPKMNGLEAMRHIFDTCPVPVILLTAHDTESFIVDAGMIGAAGYLVKPSNIREIDRAITIGLARFNDIMELRRVNARLEEAVEKVRQLSRLLPICSECRMVRNDQGYWEEIEAFYAKQTGATLMEGLCPSCKSRHKPNDGGVESSEIQAAAGLSEAERTAAVPGSEVLMSGNTLKVFRHDDIKYIQAEDEYSLVFTVDGKKHVVRRLLKEWEASVPPALFLRIHRSYLINLNHVAKIEKWFNRAYRVFMKDVKEPIIMSRRYTAQIRGRVKERAGG
ncbi:MAG: LytR/AlgR family response regulator transcription factor [Acidobacteriota bacterium]